MIEYRAFTLARYGLLPNDQKIRANFDRAPVEANAWISRESIDVIDVETIGNGEHSVQIRAIRVWHRMPSLKPQSSPEV